MSAQTPPRLVDLAGRHLLRADDLDFPTLESLPTELFPPLFLEAFTGYRTETLKAMVQTWPFVRLPLGALIELPHVGPLQAVLEALDVLLAQKVRSRRCKLRVLDLRNTGQSFWSMWSGASSYGCSGSRMAAVAEPRSTTKQPSTPLKVFIDLCLKKRTLDNFLTYFLRWVEQRKTSVHLCCKKLKIVSMPMDNIVKVLSMVQLDCIQEVQVSCTWNLSTLATFAPLLGEMSHLQRLRLSHVHVSAFKKQEHGHVVQITSQFRRLGHLRDLHLESPSFLEGCLDQMLRCLKSPLDSLSITKCWLRDSDLTHLSQSPDISQLKSLDLSGVTMTDFRPELLQVLLEKVAATLQDLDLDVCGITDSQLEACLPALSRCSQLSFHRSRLGGESRMSAQTPPRLVDLAGRHLLRADDLDFPTLESLPTELFPPLFLEAFTGYRTETLKAMVQTWPFVRLPLGALIELPHVGPLQAVLEALDVLLAQKVRSRRCKLRVLDLRNTGQSFWSMWSGASSYGCSGSRMAAVAEPRSTTKQPSTPLKVFIDLCLKKRTLDNFLTYFLRWVEQRKTSVHLCCKKLKIVSMPMDNIVKVLSMVQLDCIQEVQVSCTWNLSTLATFAPLLGEMSHLQRLRLSHVHVSAFKKQEHGHVVQITSQFRRLGHLRDLHLESPSFLEGCLDQMLRCLKSPLDSLSITKCWLRDSDLTHLSQSPDISQLKSLDLSGVTMTDFRPELLQVLLEKVAATLQDLDLDVCGITDSQLEACLPALSRCSQLSFHRSRLGGESRMSAQTPPRLVDLAGRHLLRADDLDFPTLESLPTELFPPLFLEAFTGYRTETLKAMVQTWPFVRLPLGALIELPHVGPLQAVLEALDVLLAQKVRSRRCKLRVLDLRNTGQSFWSMWSGASSYGCSGSRMAAVAEPRSTTKQPSTPLKVFIDLCLKKRTLDNFLTYFLRWVEQRKTSVHLCCKKLKIVSMPMDNIVKVLSMVQLDCIQEVQVSCTWNLSTLATFAPLLGEMSHLQRLRLSHVHVSAFKKQEHGHVVQITSQFRRLGHLRDLHLESPSFLEGCLDQMLRCLKSPLDSLSITKCWLRDSDLTHLSQSPDISQLKSLDLSGVTMTDFRPELLQVLLEKVAATLQDLDLDVCGITDSQLEACLPALSRCSQLSFHRSRLGGESRMSAQTPPRLVDLAGRHLLRADDLDFPTLESLPTELFPPLFLEAFTGYRTETLKAMVQTWPFVRLPLGALIELPHVGPLQAVLEALDVLLAQKVRSRRCKLRVLDLRNTGQSFWSMWSGASSYGCSGSRMAAVAEPRSTTKQPSTPLKVFIDLCLKKRTLDNFLTYFLRWVEQRKTSVHLCCKKLKIVSMPMDNIVKVLSMVQLDCIQEVQVSCTWNLSTLATFAPLLGEMSHLQRLRLSHVHVSAFKKQEHGHVVQITSQFRRLGHLRDLHLESPSFLEGCLDQMLRCLKSPLDSLSITKCWLRDSDLTHLSQSPDISQLKSLDLSGVTMTDFRPELLQVLLEKVAATLQDLDLDVCGITDSQLEACLPALSRCSQLSFHRSRLGGESRMSAQTPPRLVDLAGRHLLRADDLDFPTLESLPTELFPPLFLEAFTGYRTETLKAMVQTWPFVRLPLGALIELPHVGPLQAVLEALDVLLAQKVRSRRCKLRVLDLRNTGQSFWSMWSGASSYGCSGSRMAAVAEPRSTTKQPSTPLKVFIDLCLKKRTLDNFLTYFLRWVEQRKTSVHLCCKKLKIVSMPMDNIVKVLSMVQLDCIQEVQVSCTWNLSTLATFAPLLGEMSHLQRLRLSHVHVSAFKKQEHGHVVQITSQFRRLGHLRDLHLESPSFLEGCLDQMLRCLKSPLDSLSITKCWLRDSDLTHLSQSPDISQLKSLDLSGVTMTDFRPELLQVLLEKVAATLQDLDLDVCGITDSQLEACLPALSRCSQLRSVSLCGNLLSTAGMEKLLRHTAVLPCLRQERYPAPQESYRPRGVLLEARLAQLRAQLWEILRDLGHPRIIWISLSPWSSLCFHRSRLGGESRMSAQTPPRLVDLAGRHLLRADDLDFPTLESLPTELFPPLFLEAFTGYRTETLKAMVQTWPFVRLPLGALIELPHVGPLQAVLEALDVLLAQKVRSRRCKLRVLDLRNTGQSFWSMWSGASSYGCSGSRMAAVAEPRSTTKQPSTPLKVFIDLCLKKRTLDNFLTYFLRWVEQRKTSVHLCCKKLKIVSMPMDNIVKVLSMVQLDCIQEVQVSCTWNLSTLATFAPLLGEMSHLQRLRLSHVHVSAFKKQEHGHVVQITSQFRRLGHLRDLHLESPSFLEGCLDQMLRCLKSPLDSLSITKCWLRDSDLTHLSQSPDISQLKSLDLSGVTMTDFRPELLQVLLEKVAATLQDLDLDVCGITDSQLEACLPALSRCSQLRSVSLCGNLLSTAGMEKLLRHTAVLPCLRQERYPAPQESYRPRGVLLEARLAQLRAQLWEILRDLGHPRIIWISLSPWSSLCFHRSRLGGESRMSAQTPPRLVDLAGRHLLRADDLDFPTLESLPTELFPPLFLEAFTGYRTETLKAMVQTWPFVRLPLGALIELPHVGPLQAVLEALDVLLAQKVRSRRCKLRVLDLRNTGQSFWSMWSGASSYGCSGSRMAAVAEPRSTTKQPSTPLKVFIDLCLKKRTLDNFLTYFLRWVEQRKTSVHLCCKKLKIVSMPMDNIVKVLSMVQLDCIQEVQVSCTWNLSTLATFAPLLGEMSHLQRLRLSHVHVSAFKKQEHGHVVQITSQFRRLGHLRDLHLESPSFLEGCLDQMLRCLKSPLDSLSITKCWLRDSDLTHLSQSPDISQLKSLDLSGVTMTDFRPELLQVLLEKVAATLQDLDLDVCGITDSQLEACLPALSRCSQLRSVSLCGNLLSTAGMEKLLRHTAVLPCLRQERYPAPQESYRPRGVLLEARLAQLRAQLWEILRDLGHPRIIWISLSPWSSLCFHRSRLGGESRMSAQTPPRLVDLAGRHLLRADDLDFPTLESLPTELFPPLFLEAFTGYRTETLKAMVQTWPFVRLPLGALIELPHVGPLQAVLEALDVLLAQKVRSRRCKLRVLDLRNTGQSFWSMWSGASSYGCSGSRMAAVAEPRSTTKQPSTPLKVFIDLCLKKRTLDNFLTYFLRWVEQRKTSVHLCCKKLKIVSMPMDNIVKVLSMVQLDCIQEVQVSCTWNLSTLATFAPLLGEMSHLQRLRLSHVHVSAFKKQEHGHVVQITSQFRRLGHLRDLHLESPSFLEGCLDQMLRCLKSPLDSLSITKCWLRDSDLTHLSQSPDISQLKSLDLSGVTMTDFRPELLQVLLEKVAATLQDLDLDVCGITDSQLEACLPALSRCSQLRSVSLCGNLLSTAGMEKLLRHTAVLPCLRQERYPAPQESYRPRGVLLEARLAQLRAQLWEILRDLGHPRIIWISLSPWSSLCFHRSRLGGESRMSAQTPPRLVDLAGRHLLRADDLDFPTLESLPTELFPPLFLEAFTGYRTETLKAMVQTWPFVRLPLGALIELPHVGPLQAVLEALDVLLAQKVRSRRCKLRVLDLRNTGQSFWSMWSGASSYGCSGSRMAAVAEPRSTTKQPSTPLKVFIDLCLKKRTLDNFLTYFLRWVEQRKTSVHLCCKKLKIVSMPMDNIVKVLSMVQLDCIQEVQVSCTWNLSTLATFAPLLGEMSHLQRLRLSHVHVSAFKKQEHGHVVQITSQFRRLGHLRDLHLESPSFLEGCLDQMLRCLKSPLDSLSITKCWLRDSDLTHLSQSPDISQLKSLDLSGVTMTDFRPELLQVLLEKVAATLQDLDLDVCGITDSQLEACLPALSRCSQLRSVSLCGNLLSTAGMEKLLRHTAVLPCLRQERYPAPQESYRPRGVLLEARLAQLRAQLWEILRDLGHPRIIWISLSPWSSLCFHRSRLGGESRMSAQTPPRLVDLAGRHLLRADDLDFPTLESLPTELFPPLFLEAFTGYRTETLKAMVQTWPFVRLPLGALIELPHVGPLQAVLEALDVLLAQKVRSRRCKLRVLDLRNTGQSFWSMWSGASSYGCSGSRMAAVAEPRSTTKQPSTPLKVFIDLCLKKRTLDNFLTYFLRWVEQRKTSVHLCCKKLKIVSMPMDNIVKVLSMVQLDCIQEVQVSCTWNLSTLATFAPLLGEMSHLQRLRLSHVHVSAFKKQEHGHVVQITSQFRRLGHLRDLHLESPSFLEGCLDQMLRCLKSPLDSLSITKCWLRDSDLTHLSQSPDISQLKSLDLSGVTMTDFRPELLQVLLEKVAATLQDLDLDVCGITDSQLEACLPALSRCSQLRSVSLCGNLLSTAGMEKLLRHTAVLPCLRQERYPAPQESYRPRGVLLEARLAQLRAQLWEILRDLGHPRIIWISLSPWSSLCFHRSRLGGESRMSAQTPPRLVDLAGRHLLRADDLDFPTLESLPTELFPPLFLEAFTGYRTETLKAMVQTWPFVRLPLGALIELPHVGPLQAVLEALDVLLAQKVRSRRCKLRVLDLRNTGQSFWSMWSGASSYGCSGSRMAAVAEPRSTTKQPSTPLKVFIDLCLKKRTLDNFLTYFLRWVEQRKTSVHLCCKKLKIVSMPMDNIVKVLSMVQLDCIQEVQVSCTWNLSTLATFAPLLGEMSHLQRLRLSHVHVSAFKKQEHGHVVQITSQFRRLGHLRDLHLESPSFLEGCLDQMLRCLKSPLDSLSITKCWLRDSDLTHLSQSPDISQLKSLDLSGVTMTDFRPELLQVLLEKVAATLQDLDLDVCGITDSQLEACLPALSRCSQLSFHRSRLGGESRMSAQTPPRLVDLAGRHLLRADDLDFPTLESLPTELFPPLFLEAFTGYRTETLKAMVQTWPFVRLPLGALIELPHVGPLQAVLEALDVLLAQKVRSRRCKLRVLDLRNTGQSFWSMWSGASSYGCSGSRMAAVAEPRSTTKQPSTPLKVFIDLCLKKRTLDNFLTYFLRWVEQRKTSVHLCCKKLKIVSMPMDNIVKVLSMVQLDCIQEVQVSCTWNLSTLATFAPLLGEMSHLQRLRLSHVHVSAFKKQEHGHVVQITSQFRRLGHLRDLHLESPSFLEGCLDQMLRCLKSPLDSLSITKCWLRDSDLTHLSQSPDISQLKSLDLSGVTMTDFRPELLQVLLEKVAATLQDLDLDVCGITDSQLEACLPALSRCSQLRSVSLCGNLLSTAGMEKLLRHTAVLPCLRQERYPAPQESYKDLGVFSWKRDSPSFGLSCGRF
ncbi:hypothetical protein MG293_012967 [Ovis ammon polii]|uniref:Uncharacterized protein n=1 Tax=Ovis ammon polii TaxID=230172 RepID=A0AAD4U2Q4_OVIAM|nr:hypothetical protein MG293_012967 [Ovis ammon polii]